MIVKLPTGQFFIVEGTVCRDDLVAVRSQEKARKYEQLANDIARTHHKRPHVLVFAVGTIGVVSKETVKAAEKLNSWGVPIELSKMQRTAAIESVRIMNKVLALDN